MKPHTIVSQKNLPESEFELEVEIAHETLAKHRTASLKKIGATVSIPGFRVGHVPENILIQKVGEPAILEEAAYTAIDEVLPGILGDIKQKVIGEPRISITKLALGNPLAFKMTLSVVPEVTLPDYKKIAGAETAKKPEEISVSDKELDDFISNIQKSYAKNAGGNAPDAPGKTSEVLPALTDDFVKKLGDFKNVEDFKTKVKENLAQEKIHKVHEKKRLTIAEAILGKTEVVVPKALIESELAKMLARFHDDVTRMGVKLEDYLKQVKKTEEDLRKDWRPDAEKHAKLQLVLSAIAEKEKIEASKDAVDHDVKHLLEQYKDVDPKRAEAYVTMMLVNEKVFEFLESQK